MDVEPELKDACKVRFRDLTKSFIGLEADPLGFGFRICKITGVLLVKTYRFLLFIEEVKANVWKSAQVLVPVRKGFTDTVVPATVVLHALGFALLDFF